MSSLWTPEGEHRVRPAGDDEKGPDAPRTSLRASEPAPGADPGAGSTTTARADHAEGADFDPEQLGPEEQAELAGRLDELRSQLLGTPAEVVVANHAYGLFELAAIHLSQQPPQPDQARLAVDAMAALVEGLAGRLGESERSLHDALAQIRLAFVQIMGTLATDDAGDEIPAP